ncbi:hypothetical protein [Paenibacillus lautus]|uniref:hypothetical protein n=1 Tax=Paenibacillus lautus TaxID=1401 RepID=UPI000BBD9521|nr:hypothetical protein [Paenibacillus lautus]PCL95023.1 hypothetical protein CPZ30_04840 [Paenibacillus lautus]
MKSEHLFNDLEEYRNAKEMKAYFDYIYESTRSDQELMKQARLKKGKYKQFFEEFYPLYLYSQSLYCNENSRMRIVLGNQQYDAIVIQPDGIEERFEFTSYIDGEWEFQDAKKLNERGYGDIRFNYRSSLDERDQEYINKIRKNAVKKSTKDYSEVNLMFVVNTLDYFEIYGRESNEFVRILKDEILNIKFKTRRIFLLVLNTQGVENIDQNLYLLQE